ncbi:MAG TPA: galactokinase [Polyangia bacterium]
MERQPQRIATSFRTAFATAPALLVRGPGRVNLLGEHTDYNLGFVLPAAIDRAVWMALSPRPDRRCRFHSVDLGEDLMMDLGHLNRAARPWANYLLGVLSELEIAGLEVRGVDVAFGGDVPIGSGMSSSAALTCGFAFGLNTLFDLGLDRVALARLGQRAENRFVGVNCGIMDQFASLLGQAGRLIRLDCRDLSFSHVPFERTDLRLVLCDTQVRRALAGSEYNVRRAQCEAGVAVLAKHHPAVKSLRDATQEMLEVHRSEMDPVVFRRCAYVVNENQRVVAGCAALERDDVAAFGACMNGSHAGLRDEYQVSCTELDTLAAAAQALPGVLGSRMMGAGFGGCTLNLVESESLDVFRAGMAPAFTRLGVPPLLHVCRLTGGTGIENV